MQKLKVSGHRKVSSEVDFRSNNLPHIISLSDKSATSFGCFYKKKYYPKAPFGRSMVKRKDAAEGHHALAAGRGSSGDCSPLVDDTVLRASPAKTFDEPVRPTHCYKGSGFLFSNIRSVPAERGTLGKLARFLKTRKSREDTPASPPAGSCVAALVHDLDDFVKTLPGCLQRRKELLCARLDKYAGFLAERTSPSGEEERLARLIASEAVALQNGSDASRARRAPRDKGTQTCEERLQGDRLIAALREYALTLINAEEGAEFDAERLREVLERHGSAPLELDFDLQKVLKVYVDVLQKQLFFDEIAALLQEGGVDVQGIFQASIRKTMAGLLDARESDRTPGSASQSSQAKSRSSGSRRKTPPSSPTFNIDLAKVTQKRPDNQTPKGFHQEFMARVSEFSLSWRQKCAPPAQPKQS